MEYGYLIRCLLASVLCVCAAPMRALATPMDAGYLDFEDKAAKHGQHVGSFYESHGVRFETDTIWAEVSGMNGSSGRMGITQTHSELSKRAQPRFDHPIKIYFSEPCDTVIVNALSVGRQGVRMRALDVGSNEIAVTERAAGSNEHDEDDDRNSVELRLVVAKQVIRSIWLYQDPLQTGRYGYDGIAFDELRWSSRGEPRTVSLQGTMSVKSRAGKRMFFHVFNPTATGNVLPVGTRLRICARKSAVIIVQQERSRSTAQERTLLPGDPITLEWDELAKVTELQAYAWQDRDAEVDFRLTYTVRFGMVYLNERIAGNKKRSIDLKLPTEDGHYVFPFIALMVHGDGKATDQIFNVSPEESENAGGGITLKADNCSTLLVVRRHDKLWFHPTDGGALNVLTTYAISRDIK